MRTVNLTTVKKLMRK